MEAKLTRVFVTSLFAIFFSSSCGKKSEDKTEKVTSADCFYRQTNQVIGNHSSSCNFDYNSHMGFKNYDPNLNSHVFNGSLMGCGTAHEIVYNGEKGLGCVESGAIFDLGRPIRYVLDRSNDKFVPSRENINMGVRQILWVCTERDDCHGVSGARCLGIRSGSVRHSNRGAVGAIGICSY